jgi:DedD protein
VRTAAPASAPPATAPTRVASAPRADEAARARALLEAKAPSPAPTAPTPSPVAPAEGGRFIVQVGAYSDATTLREARARVERLGLKTYTQVIDSEGGPRTRVRIGPFATREEATAAANKLKGAGLPGNVLAL